MDEWQKNIYHRASIFEVITSKFIFIRELFEFHPLRFEMPKSHTLSNSVINLHLRVNYFISKGLIEFMFGDNYAYCKIPIVTQIKLKLLFYLITSLNNCKKLSAYLIFKYFSYFIKY